MLATAMRQSAEWGMRALQCSIPCLKERLVYKEFGQCRLTLKLLVLLHNLRGQKVGINQTRNVYMPHLNKDANKMFCGDFN
jgi:hypothetical protein